MNETDMTCMIFYELRVQFWSKTGMYKNSKDFKDCKIQLKNTGINDFIELENNSFMGLATARSLGI